jgi:hypothetical protein
VGEGYSTRAASFHIEPFILSPEQYATFYHVLVTARRLSYCNAWLPLLENVWGQYPDLQLECIEHTEGRILATTVNARALVLWNRNYVPKSVEKDGAMEGEAAGASGGAIAGAVIGATVLAAAVGFVVWQLCREKCPRDPESGSMEVDDYLF